MTDAKANKPKEKEKTKYRVLDWGAGSEDSPCSIVYIPQGGTKPRRAKAGDIIDDLPLQNVGRPGQELIRDFILGYHIEAVE